MSYNPLIPQATDKISVSQSQILGNFTQIPVVIDPATGQLTLYSIATPALPASTIGIYNKASSLYIKNDAATEVPINGAAACLTTTAGWTYLPSKLILQWMNVAVPNDGAVHANNLPIAFPNDMLFVTCSVSNAPASTTLVYSATASRNGASLISVNIGLMTTYGPAGLARNVSVFAIGY